VNEQPLNLHASLQEIWRHRMLFILVAALCGLSGIIYGVLKPTNQTAVALVLLPPGTASNAAATGNSGVTGNSGASGNDIHTDAVIANSTPVLAAAGAKMSPPLGAAGVRNLVTVQPLSGQVLQIQVRAPVSGYAVQLSNAVASSYVDYVGQLQASSAGLGLADLKKESTNLTHQINNLQTQINTVFARITSEAAASRAGEQDAALVDSLQSEQSQVSLQLNTVASQIASAQVAKNSTGNTTRILQRGAAEPVSRDTLPLEAGLIGIAIGLLGTLIFVLLRLQRGQRLRLRDEIARAAGAPVIASLDAPSCTMPSAWRDFLNSPPRATNEWALRHVLHSLRTSGGQRLPQRIRVISFAGDSPALTTGPRLALHSAASGTRTALLPDDLLEIGESSLVSLWAAFTGADPAGRGLPLTVGQNHDGDDPPQLLVSIVIFDGTSAIPSSPDTVNLLSLSSNFVTADELAQLALKAVDGGSALDGIVVANPEPADKTSGLLADDTLRLLPPPGPGDGGDDEPALFVARSNTANGSSDGFLGRDR
jgi:capsular polysaccharide biosynthesis protein